MSVQELIERVQRDAANNQRFDFKSIREQIHDEFDRARTAEERVQLLMLFKASTDLVERNLAHDPDALEKLRNVRENDYRLFIIKECMVDENVCADTMYALTAREIAAGRMSPDHSLRTLAERQMGVPHPLLDDWLPMVQKPKPRRGFLGRLFGRWLSHEYVEQTRQPRSI